MGWLGQKPPSVTLKRDREDRKVAPAASSQLCARLYEQVDRKALGGRVPQKLRFGRISGACA